MKAPVIRISIGKFDAEKAVIVEKKLAESRARLGACLLNPRRDGI